MPEREERGVTMTSVDADFGSLHVKRGNSADSERCVMMNVWRCGLVVVLPQPRRVRSLQFAVFSFVLFFHFPFFLRSAVPFNFFSSLVRFVLRFCPPRLFQSDETHAELPTSTREILLLTFTSIMRQGGALSLVKQKERRKIEKGVQLN